VLAVEITLIVTTAPRKNLVSLSSFETIAARKGDIRLRVANRNPAGPTLITLQVYHVRVSKPI